MLSSLLLFLPSSEKRWGKINYALKYLPTFQPKTLKGRESGENFHRNS